MGVALLGAYLNTASSPCDELLGFPPRFEMFSYIVIKIFGEVVRCCTEFSP